MTTTDLHTPGSREPEPVPTLPEPERPDAAGPGPTPSRPLRAYLIAGAGYLVLSLFVWSNIWTSHPTTVTTCGCGDSSLFTWYLEWPAYALTHGLNPFFSTAMHYPTGVNIPANTSELFFGFLLLPVTWAFGPIATLNVALTVTPVLSSLGMFALLRRWVTWTPAAFLGGLFYGFSPFVVAELSDAHLMLGLVVVPPLVVACLDELLLRQSRRPAVTGVLLGLLVALQFFIGTEILLMMIMMAVGGLVVLVVYAALRRPEALRARAGHAAVGLVVGGATALVLLAYPAWYGLAGPRHYTGPVWPGKANSVIRDVSTTLSGLVHPMSPAAAAQFHAYWVQTGGYQGKPISSWYFGVGMVVVVAGGVAAWRRDRRLWFFGVMTVVAVLLSLGASSTYPLPWTVLANQPVLVDIIPWRFVFFAYLFVAVLLALIVDHTYASVDRRRRVAGTGAWGRAPRWSAAAAALVVAAVALVQPAQSVASTVPFTTQEVVLPDWFTTVAPTLDPSQVLLVFPATFQSPQSPLTWQAVDRMQYSMVNAGLPIGTLNFAGKEYAGADALAFVGLLALLPTDVHPSAVAAVRSALLEWGVTKVVLPDQPELARYDQVPSVTLAAALITAATGERPVHQARAWVWEDVDRTAPRTLAPDAAVRSCSAGLAARGAPAVTAATECVLASA